MILEEKHKEYAIKCFAQFMTRSEVTDAFMQEFRHDIPQPPPDTELTKKQASNTSIDDQLDKDEFFNIRLCQTAALSIKRPKNRSQKRTTCNNTPKDYAEHLNQNNLLISCVDLNIVAISTSINVSLIIGI